MTKSKDKMNKVIDLRLEDDAADYDDDGEQQQEPKRLLELPSGELLAYGGEDGTVTCLLAPMSSVKATTIQRYDDGAVRAMAVSMDGKRIAVGFDTGTTQIYTYKEYVGGESPHPFVAKSTNKTETNKNDDALFSQDLSMFEDPDADNCCMAGPQFDAPIRDLKFHPTEHHLLAIATESTMCVVDVTDSDTLIKRYLQTEAEQHHDRCGIRGLAFTSPSPGENNKHVSLSSLAMDGRLCVWNVSGPPSTWKLIERESRTCITKKDVGEIHGADPFDRSCFPLCLPVSGSGDSSRQQWWVATPGKLQVYLRRLSCDAGASMALQAIEQDDNGDGYEQNGGHTESIVAMASIKDIGSSIKNTKINSFLVTSGRDRRVLLWKIVNQDGRVVLHQTLGQCVSTPTHLMVLEKFVYATCVNGSCVVFELDGKFRNDDERVTETGNEKQKIDKGETTGSVDKPLQTKEDPRDGIDDDEDQNQRKRLKKKKASTKDQMSDDDDDDIDFSEPTSSQEKRVRFVDDEADEENENVDGEPEQKMEDGDKQKDLSNKSEEQSAQSIDNDDNITSLDNGTGNDNDFEDDDNDVNFDDDDDGIKYNPLPSRQQMIPVVEAQPAFAPSSTPLDLQRRFLCWNHIGSITLLRGEDDVNNRNTVDISFTDSATRRPISFTDNMNFIVGSIGEDGAIFASDLNDDDQDNNDDNDLQDIVDGLNISEQTKAVVKRSHRKRMMKKDESSKPTGSSIYFHRFKTFGSIRDKDWYLTLPDGERVMGSACGEGWAAVITSRRFLRMFTSGGNQGQLVWLKGEPVTMTGRSRFMAVFYHEGTPLSDGTQKLGYSLYDVTNFREISKGSVSCISNGSSLSWVGFNNDGSLMVMDTDGMLSMLIPTGGRPTSTSTEEDENAVTQSYSWEWAPVLDTIGLRKSANDLFWPVAVHGGKLICVPLRGGNQYPDAARRPVTTSLNLRVPLARSTIAKTALLEELSVRSNIALSHKKVLNDIGAPIDTTSDQEEFEQEYLTLCAQVDKVTLKLFAATVDAGKLERALDLVDRLHLEKSYDLAMTLADRHRKLTDLIEDAKERKFGYLDQEDEEDMTNDYEEDEEDEYDENERRYNNNNSKPTTTRMASTKRHVSPESRLKRPYQVGENGGSTKKHCRRKL